MTSLPNGLTAISPRATVPAAASVRPIRVARVNRRDTPMAVRISATLDGAARNQKIFDR